MPSAKRYARLDQLIASLGYGSRRDVEGFIKRGRLKISGTDKLTSDLRIDPALISFDGEPLDHPNGILVLLNKPVGYVCTHNEEEGQTVYELLPERWRKREPQVVTIGRLDKDTSGLLLLTDQHDLVHRLTSPKHHVDKIYEADLDRPLPQEAADIFKAGTLILKGETRPCLPAHLEIISEKKARITLQEGRYHQVRRMFAAIGNHVVALQRLQFGHLGLTGVAEGQYKHLSIDSFTT
jgi:16S rRNA pseudouridine516 synthase